MIEKIKNLANSIKNEIIEIRRYIHTHPELSYEEELTGKYIAKKLDDWGIEFRHGWVNHGVTALLKGDLESNNIIALRADIDALPILEKNEVPYCSQNEGVMHACGHDAHTASLLGTILILNQLKAHWGGTIKFIFQPAEEKTPGGASLMIAEGVLQNPAPNFIMAQHVHPPLEAGKVGFKSGMYMASCDEIYLTIKGKGGHGAMPQDCIDPILITANILLSLQQVVSRKGDPTVPSVLTFGKINSVGGATNVIPNEVKIEGTFRTYDEKWRKTALEAIEKMAIGIAESYGGACDVNIAKGYPFLFNDEKMTPIAKNWAIEFLGAENVVDLPMRMTSEDFSYYSHEIPGVFYRLGTGNKAKGITSALHTDTFNIDENALELGCGLMSWLAVRALGNN